jgi:thiol-disulfide isomerase/thioredoxin
MPSLDDVTKDCPTCEQYIEEMSPAYKGGFIRYAQSYELREDIVEELKKYADDYVIVALFADWCGDARRAIPVLSLLEMEIGIEVRALGGMQKPPRGSDKHWAVSPSPEEVDVFGITSSPTILIFKRSGEEVGRIKTRPKMTPTVEEEILKFIEANQD